MNNNLEDKRIIITGANSGIGKAAALRLVEEGVHVIMACRSMERGSVALQDIRRKTGSSRIDLMQVDMSSLESIRHFSADYHRKYDRLDVLIHNAANFDLNLKKPLLTSDGIEVIWATNHVGVFLLTQLMLDLLKSTAPSRVITVASKGLMVYPGLDIEFDNLNGERKFSAQHAYYHSKLAQVMFTYDLARRLIGSGVTVNCVRVPNVALDDDRLINVPQILRKIYSLKRKFSVSPEIVAETYSYLAVSPQVETISGAYWDENKKQVSSSQKSHHQETMNRLWSVTEKMAGVDLSG